MGRFVPHEQNNVPFMKKSIDLPTCGLGFYNEKRDIYELVMMKVVY